MLIELPIGQMVGKAPEDAVSYAFEYFLGATPNETFLNFYGNEVASDHLGFIRTFLSGWPMRGRAEMRTEQLDMANVQNIVSAALLMTVPAELFLELAYREFFNREVDKSGEAEYGRWDFSIPEIRTSLLAILSQSPEFAESGRKIAWTRETVPGIAHSSGTTLRWHGGAAVSKDWFRAPTSRGLFARYNPLFLWVPDRSILYTAPGIVIQGSVNGNVIQAPPEWVVWGPKSPMAQGIYKVRCDISLSPNDLVILDISSGAGAKVHRKIEFFGELKVELPLELDADTTDIEMRLFNLTGRNIEIRIREISISTS